jgi:hypothetical protein
LHTIARGSVVEGRDSHEGQVATTFSLRQEDAFEDDARATVGTKGVAESSLQDLSDIELWRNVHLRRRSREYDEGEDEGEKELHGRQERK